MATEMKSSNQGKAESRSEAELDPQALAAIRELLDTQPKAKAKPAAKRQAPQQVEGPGGMAENAAPAPKPPKFARTQDVANPAAKPAHKPGRAKKPSLKSALTGYRPTTKHILLASLALLILFRPWLVVGLAVINLLLFIAVFLFLGYDAFWNRVIRLAQWYARRRPSRAAALHRKLDSFAIKWDNFLDFFPEGSVDGLYLPDFGELAQADARHDAALERRLSGLRDTQA